MQTLQTSNKFLNLAVCIAIVVSLFLPSAASISGVTKSNSFHQLLEKYIEDSGAISGVLYILKDGEFATADILADAAFGYANLKTQRTASSTDLFRYASISKTYIAMLAAKAHLEGKITLDDILESELPRRAISYLPQEIVNLIPNSDKTTWRTLLNHSCSIYDYRDGEFTKQLLLNPFVPMVDEIGQLKRGLSRGIANGEASVECELFYSNSNYVVLGLMLDRLYGDHHSVELRTVLAKMGLNQTYYEKHYSLDHHPDLELLNHSYVALPERDALLDATWADDGYGFANGGLIGTPENLARFYSIVFSDRVAHPMSSLEEKRDFLQIMTRPNRAGLALGNMVSDGYYSHGGTIGGHSTIALYSPKHRTAIVFYTNDATRHGSLRYEITNEIKRMLE